MVLVGLGAISFVVVLFTFAGPLGTAGLAPLPRLAYWSICVAAGWPICYFKNVVPLYLLRFRAPRAILAAQVATSLVTAMPCAAIVHTAATWFDAQRFLPGLPEVFVLTFSVTALYSLLIHFVVSLRTRNGDTLANADAADAAETGNPAESPAPATEANAPRPPATTGSPFWDRMPADLGRELIYLRVDDHYVQAFTDAGSARVLMRFTDIVAELGDRGMRVHRSYWVAYRHVVSIVARDGRTVLRLTDAHEVPVGPSYLEAVLRAIRRD